MHLIKNLLSELNLFVAGWLERVGLGDTWYQFNVWRGQGQNQKIVTAAALLVLTLIILVTYACSQRPDL